MNTEICSHFRAFYCIIKVKVEFIFQIKTNFFTYVTQSHKSDKSSASLYFPWDIVYQN